ncbi:copper homeostasis protein [Flavobacterium sp. IR1]|nr:copper homeostasis protein [Flavobacterium sp. IR1]
MKKIFLIILISGFLFSCNSRRSERVLHAPLADMQSSIIADTKSLEETSIYEGVLPCADCSGIQTILKIYQGDGTMESHKFELTTIYKGKSPEKKFFQKGNFNLERGFEQDPNGTVYILNWNLPEEKQLYFGYNAGAPNKLYALDHKRQKNKSDLNYTLTLKEL